MDYWSLSFTSEELAAGLTPEIIHSVACAFSYPSLKVRFETKEYKNSSRIAEMSDYETEIGRRYLSYEQWKEENPYSRIKDITTTGILTNATKTSIMPIKVEDLPYN